jgi:acyl-CoA-binding protein
MAKKAGHVPMLTPESGTLYQVPLAELEYWTSRGMVPASAEQEQIHYEKKEYAEKTSDLEKSIKGAAAGAASGVLGIPAAVAHLTGIDEGASGPQYLSKIINYDDSASPAIAESRVRTTLESAPVSSFVGEMLPYAAGGALAKGATTALATRFGAKAAAKATATGATAEAAAARGAAAAGRVGLATDVAEAAATNVVAANNQMFVENREATGEVLMLASALGAVGPLAISPALRYVGKVGKTGVGKLDDFRTARAEKVRANALIRRTEEATKADPAVKGATMAQRKAEAAISDAEAGIVPPSVTRFHENAVKRATLAEEKALARVERFKSLTEASDIEKRALGRAERNLAEKQAEREAADLALKAQSKVRVTGPGRASRSQTSKLAGPDAPTVTGNARARTVEALAAEVEAGNLTKGQAFAKLAKMTKRGAVTDGTVIVKSSRKAAEAAAAEAAEQRARLALDRATSRLAKAEARAMAADPGDLFPTAVAAREGAEEAAKRAAFPSVDEARATFEAATRALDEAKAKVGERVVRDFTWKEPPRAKFMDLFTEGKRATGAADLLTEAAEKAEDTRRLAVGASYLVENRFRTALGGGAASGAGFGIGKGIGAAVAGGVLGSAVVSVAPRAAGWVLKRVAEGFKKSARIATEMAKTPGRANVGKAAVTARALKGVARQAYRQRYLALISALSEDIDRIGADPMQFIESSGETYGDLESNAPGTVDVVTRNQMEAIGYLKREMPAMPPKFPAMPHLGNKEPSLPEMESYMRKVQAVTDPSFIIKAIANGELHTETVEAMDAVYPILMLDLRTEVLDSLSTATQPLDRKQAISLDKLFGSVGAVHPPNNLDYQFRIGVISEEEIDKMEQESRRRKPGRAAGSPTFWQQMKSPTQNASESLGG